MRSLLIAALLLCLAALAPTSGRAAESAVPIGSTIQDLRFKDIRALNRSLRDLGEHQAFVFVFTTTKCPLVRKYLPRLIELDAEFGARGVQLVAVNVGADDTIRDMASQALEFNAEFPFVKDSDGSVAKALGAERTPTAVVLDGKGSLVYRGRIDDQHRLGGTRPDVTNADLRAALESLLAGRPINVSETPVDGCLISAERLVADGLQPTFHEQIAPLLHARCAGCHHPGTAAPFSLLTYEDARSQGEMLAEVVADQRMPPWFASPRHGKFQNDPSLTARERRTLLAWVKTGMAEGDPAKSPKPPEFPSRKWRIGEPDMVITMLQNFDVPAQGYIPYQYVILPHIFFNETWVEAVEILPDNPAVVHHCNMAYATQNGAGEETFITGYVPGGQAMDVSRFNNGVAFRIPKFAVLALQVHYTSTGKPEKSRISVGLRFPKGMVQKSLRHMVLDTGRLNITPGRAMFPVTVSHVLSNDVTLLGLFTHMHLRGRDMTFFAEAPGQKRETLLEIPNYNFEWQLAYEFAPGTKRLPAGTKLEALAHYDNSAFNPYNPDPKRTVPYGQQTFDEMFNGFAFFIQDDEALNLKVNPKTGVAVK